MKTEFRSYRTEKEGNTHLNDIIVCDIKRESAFISASYNIGLMDSVSKLVKKGEFEPWQMKKMLSQLAQLITSNDKMVSNTILLDIDKMFWNPVEKRVYFLSIPIQQNNDMNNQLRDFLGDVFGKVYTANDKIKQTVAMLYMDPVFTVEKLTDALNTQCADITEKKKGLFRGLFKKKEKKQAVIKNSPTQPSPIKTSNSQLSTPLIQPSSNKKSEPLPTYNRQEIFGRVQEDNPTQMLSDDNTTYNGNKNVTTKRKSFIVTFTCSDGSLKSIENFPALLGRSPEASCVVTGSGVSRIHAELSIENDKVYISDAGSKFGTFVDGEKLSEGEKVILLQGTNLVLGGADFEITEIKEI